MRAKFHAARLITISGGGPGTEGRKGLCVDDRRPSVEPRRERDRTDRFGRRGPRRDIFRISWRTADTCCRHGRLGFIGIREISRRSGPAGWNALRSLEQLKNAIRARIGERRSSMHEAGEERDKRREKKEAAHEKIDR